MLNGISVLVVDDNEDSREMFAIALRFFGATVETAATASDGLRVVETRRLGVIVCDITLPDLSGYEFIGRVRALSDGVASETPAIAVTGHVSEEDRARALEAGFQLHVAKPVEPMALAKKIAALAMHDGESR